MKKLFLFLSIILLATKTFALDGFPSGHSLARGWTPNILDQGTKEWFSAETTHVGFQTTETIEYVCDGNSAHWNSSIDEYNNFSITNTIVGLVNFDRVSVTAYNKDGICEVYIFPRGFDRNKKLKLEHFANYLGLPKDFMAASFDQGDWYYHVFNCDEVPTCHNSKPITQF